MASETAIDSSSSDESGSLLLTLQKTVVYIPVILLTLLLLVFAAVGLLELRKIYLRRAKRKSLTAASRSAAPLAKNPAQGGTAIATDEVLRRPSLSPTLASVDALHSSAAKPVDVSVETEPRLERVTPSHHHSNSMTRIHNQHALQHQKDSKSDSIRLASIEEGMMPGKDDIV